MFHIFKNLLCLWTSGSPFHSRMKLSQFYLMENIIQCFTFLFYYYRVIIKNNEFFTIKQRIKHRFPEKLRILLVLKLKSDFPFVNKFRIAPYFFRPHALSPSSSKTLMQKYRLNFENWECFILKFCKETIVFTFQACSQMLGLFEKFEPKSSYFICLSLLTVQFFTV